MSDKDNLLFGVKPRYARKSLYRGSPNIYQRTIIEKDTNYTSGEERL